LGRERLYWEKTIHGLTNHVTHQVAPEVTA